MHSHDQSVHAQADQDEKDDRSGDTGDQQGAAPLARGRLF